MNSIAKKIILFIIVCFTNTLSAQMNPNFFPDFQPYSATPIIKYGDGFADAAWNDPTILKENGQYIMYISAAVGITGVDKVKIYRQISNDGYSWTLSPTTPVLEPDSGTYYSGGVETPSVVFKDNVYHMYTTCYPANIAEDFVLAHATSTDGINWTMDAAPILESPGTATWYGSIVGEPGAIVYRDSIFVFFTAGVFQASLPIQCIGLLKSADGTNFGIPSQAVFMPQDVYPTSSGYWGLSTPSALTINDSIYLFTDVAQVIGGNWTQVALHQFKTEGSSGVWYHEPNPIHVQQDFTWTNGNYLSEIRSITALMDDNDLLRIWYAGNHIADISGTDTTYNVTVDAFGIHVLPDYWGIGTSEYQFTVPTTINENKNQAIQVYPNPATSSITLVTKNESENHKIINVLGQVILSDKLSSLSEQIDISSLPTGMYFLQVDEVVLKIQKN